VNAAAFTVERWHSDEGCKIALVKRGTKNLHMCVQDFPVHVETRPLAEERYLTPLDYSSAKAARRMREFAKHGNHTASAMAMLKEALA
jgi:hypothetical protein